ncbi:endonuclease/exonuclease/phosphatase family protein [Chryseobacterium sp. ERMR1:04]|uniref:endonuclease/exonuclease/phosphatase family protein n=1 Tax=Chryseobacterium sp. ERMR1:04 TaxID=1705393 RepID=UPI0006C8AB46|nr:endonuclease/exonuclease/phosphatase family protein [Chryseobacterium sp. ERMR1:04]KPH12593.1 hypothetical protein AMQ68_17055 [Chryseobacterium sp. ERMR1:04]
MKFATLNIDWARKKDSLKIEELIDQFDFDFLILTEAINLNLKNFKYKYFCEQIPENVIYENLNYTEYLKGEKAFRTILYSKYPCIKKHTVTDDKTNQALEFETEFGNFIIYCTIIGTWFNRKPFAEKELQNTIQDCKKIYLVNKNIIIVGDLNTSFKKGEEKFSINSKTTESLRNLFDDLELMNTTKEIDKNIDHIIIPKTFTENSFEAKTFVDKDVVSDHKGIYIKIMIKIENFNKKKVEIEAFQSTFIILKIENKLFRFDFKNKKEAFLKQKDTGVLAFHEHHPLLVNHSENNLEVFISSKPENIEMFIEDIKNSIDEITKGWRNWKDYFEINIGITYDIFLQNIRQGSGIILKAPFSIVESIERICEKHNVKITYFGEKKTTPHQLIMINNQFVIAEEFNIA